MPTTLKTQRRPSAAKPEGHKARMGCGIDLVDLDRFHEAMTRSGAAFLNRIFTPAEQAYAKRHANALPRLAARFAAKEAVIKALAQIDPRRRFDLKHIEIRNDALGRPSVVVTGVPKNYPTVHISITHAERMAAACAVVMR